jgi:transposase
VAEVDVIGAGRNRRVFAHTEPCDLRKHFDSLAAIVTGSMKRPLLSGDLFLFVNRSRKRAKVLYFDGTGLCVLCKRLERGKFAALWEPKARTELTENELSLFLEGVELVGRVALSPPAVGYGDRYVTFR